MAKNPNIYKFEIIERIITEVDFKTKDEVLDFARKVRDIALEKDISSEIKNAFKNDSLQKSLKEFANCKTDVEVYEFINKNPDNFIVKMAKKSDVIKTVASNENFFVKLARKTGLMEKEVKNADKVDTRAYIDIDEFKGVAKKLEKLQNQYKNSGETLDVFLNGVKKLKRASVWKNLGSCVLALGVIAPAIMVGIRYLRNDKEFEVKERIQKELAFQGEI